MHGKSALGTKDQRQPIMMGDFNLDERIKYLNSYGNKAYYEDLIGVVEGLELLRMVNFDTWSRLINGEWKTSIYKSNLI